MINYSITMRSVNSNLLEINQAKSRINQAKREGKNPDQADLNLVKTEKFAKHISSHGSVYSRADISAILYITVDCMREQLLEGKKIRLGDLGDFSILLSSKGAEDADKFSAQNITDVKVQWEPGAEFKNLIADAEFNLVASRSAQAAVIKAIKEGKANVDISTPTTPDDGSDGGGSTPSGGSNPSGGTPAGGNTEQGGGTSQGTGSNPSGDNKGDTGQDGDGDYELK